MQEMSSTVVGQIGDMDHALLTGLNGILIICSLCTKATAFRLIDDERSRAGIMEDKVVSLWFMVNHATLSPKLCSSVSNVIRALE